MDELTLYVIKNYPGLMTIFERAAFKDIIIETKIEQASSPEYKARLKDKFLIEDATVKGLLKNGAEAFLQSVSDRILKEHANEVVINRCPKCAAIARTSIAKQCPKCFYDWH